VSDLFDPETGEIRGAVAAADDCEKCAQHAAVMIEWGARDSVSVYVAHWDEAVDKEAK